jgi:hypothetical protein
MAELKSIPNQVAAIPKVNLAFKRLQAELRLNISLGQLELANEVPLRRIEPLKTLSQSTYQVIFGILHSRS